MARPLKDEGWAQGEILSLPASVCSHCSPCHLWAIATDTIRGTGPSWMWLWCMAFPFRPFHIDKCICANPYYLCLHWDYMCEQLFASMIILKILLMASLTVENIVAYLRMWYQILCSGEWKKLPPLNQILCSPWWFEFETLTLKVCKILQSLQKSSTWGRGKWTSYAQQHWDWYWRIVCLQRHRNLIQPLGREEWRIKNKMGKNEME